MKATVEPTLFDRFFRDAEGNIVIIQPPNLPLLVFVTSTLLQFVGFGGKVQIALELIAFGSIFTWAWLEIFDGASYFRRSLGLIVLLGILAHSIQV